MELVMQEVLHQSRSSLRVEARNSRRKEGMV